MVAEAPSTFVPPPRMLSQLSHQLVGELRNYITQHRRRIERSLDTEDRGIASARQYAKVYDGLLSALFESCRAVTSQQGPWPTLSLAAVGSYGRSMLAPFSDLDVRLLCASDTSLAGPAAEALLYPLWDAGLSIGHQVVKLQDLLELAATDVITATTLLDWRHLSGDAELDRLLIEQAYASVFSLEHVGQFIDQLYEQARARHRRFGDSVYLLEPDVKNGAGGLRDLDVAHWCARARFRTSDLGELVGLGILMPREWLEVERARNVLLEVRHALHLSTGRRSDRLTFDLQDRVTERLGHAAGADAAERLMSDYYRAARVITRLSDRLFSRARPSPRRRASKQSIGEGLLVIGGSLGLEQGALERDPVLALRLYTEAVRRNLPLCERTREEILQAASGAEFGLRLRASPLASRLFLDLACVVEQTQLAHGSPLFDLHDVGLLVAMIPEFAPLVGRAHRDTYHVYTVDVHSIAAVDHLRALCRGELCDEHALASRLAAELPRRRVLFLSALLHDVGKAHGGEGHSARGVSMAAEILERLGIGAGDRAEVQRLIQHHLTMYEVATRRDLEDPRNLREFCATVSERGTLGELYLLTVADVTTTNPTSMTSWKRRMLDTLYQGAERMLTAGPVQASSRIQSARAAVRTLWGEGSDPVFIEHFTSGLPERYFYANEPESIVEHARFAQAAQSRVASIRRGAVSHPYLELWVVADDRPGLLAMITATATRARLKVRSAQVYSWVGRDGQSRSLDIFWVRGPEESEAAEELLPKLERELEKTLGGELDAAELERRVLAGARYHRARKAHFATTVHIHNESASNYTIIEVITQDRPALLFCLAHALLQMGLSIWFAKINTEGERVVDVFYVSTRSGHKLFDSEQLEHVREAVGAAVQRLELRALGPGVATAAPG
ncbi:MAG: [protein-PII] uridylyltransferase [Deltaproteobacteria bacterium]